jgi:hypothetical protein
MKNLISKCGNILNKVLVISLVTICVGFIIMFLYVVINRMFFPYDLEWIEGGVADHIYIVLHNLPLYGEPSLDHTAFVYPPIYYYITSLVASVIGMSFIPLRLVSVLSTILSMIIIGRFVFLETNKCFGVVISIGIYAASYSMANYWYDVGRVDSLMLSFLLIAMYLIKFHKSYKGIVMAGIFFAFAFLTKQEILFAFISMFAYVLIFSWRKAIVLLSVSTLIIVFSVILLDYLYNGWFSYYAFSLSVNVVRDTINISKLMEFIKLDMLSNCGFAFIIIGMAALILKPNDKRRVFFYVFFVIGMIVGVIPNRIINGGALNSSAPAFAAVSVLTGIAVIKVINYLKIHMKQSGLISSSIYSLIIALLLCAVYDLREAMPIVNGDDNRTRIVSLMRSTDGEVFSPSYGYLPTMAGKTMSASLSSFYDIITSADSYQKQKITDKFLYRLKTHYYSMIILDQYSFNLMKRDWVDVSEYYSLSPVTEDLKLYNFPIKTIHDDTLVFIPNDSNTQ